MELEHYELDTKNFSALVIERGRIIGANNMKLILKIYKIMGCAYYDLTGTFNHQRFDESIDALTMC